MQRLDLGAHLHAKLGVEVGERFVEEEHLRLAHDGAAHRHALALAARKLARVAREVVGQPEDGGRLVHPPLDRLGRLVGQLQAERHVVLHGHVRVEGVVLEHHRDVPFLGGDVVDHPVADTDLPAGDFLEPRDHAEQGGLPAARRADQDAELAVPDFDVDAVHDARRAERLPDAVEGYRSHVIAPPSSPCCSASSSCPRDGAWRAARRARRGARSPQRSPCARGSCRRPSRGIRA